MSRPGRQAPRDKGTTALAQTNRTVSSEPAARAATAASAFTLVELLVVITIIVVLISLLTPALDQAVYQAELATCGARLKAIAGGAQLYAMNFKRSYPDRPIEAPEDARYGGHRLFPHQLTAGDGFAPFGPDLRVQLDGYVSIDMLLDPLLGKIDLSPRVAPATGKVLANYAMYFGWGRVGEKAMRRLGDRWGFDGSKTSYAPDFSGTFSIIAADHERVNFWGANSHYDKDAGRLTIQIDPVIDIDPWYLSRWIDLAAAAAGSPNPPPRGPVDQNYAYTDGSVTRVGNVRVNNPLDKDTLDERMANAPTNSGGLGNIEYRNLPKQ